MNRGIRGLVLLFLPVLALAQEEERRRIPIGIEDVLRQHAAGIPARPQTDLNERLRAMSAAARFSQDYLLGPGDIIQVTVFGVDDLRAKELTLDARGMISLPFIGEVPLAGFTPREAEIKIATLFEASVMKNPQVSVSVKEYRSQFINVLGAVFKPGTYQLTRRAFLVDALAMAGGLLAEKAESRALIHRAGAQPQRAAEDDAAKPGSLEIDLQRLLEEGDISLNVPIYAGDVISVPERAERFYYVLGDVNRGGAFEIRKGDLINVTKALATAGGLMPTAKSSKTVVIRRNGEGKTVQIPLDAAKLLKGQIPDMLLERDDVVFVPGSTTRTVGRGLLNGISGVLAALVYAGIR